MLAKGASRVNVDVRRLPHLVIKGSPTVMTVAAQREANVGLAIVVWGWMGWSVGPLNSHDSHTLIVARHNNYKGFTWKVNLIRYFNSNKTTYSRVNALSPKCSYVQSVNRSMWIWTDTFMTVQCAGVTLCRSAPGCVSRWLRCDQPVSDCTRLGSPCVSTAVTNEEQNCTEDKHTSKWMNKKNE